MPHKYVVKISCCDEESAKRLADQIYEQFLDNPDVFSAYSHDKIMLTEGVGTVFLFIDDVDEVPEITLFKKENK